MTVSQELYYAIFSMDAYNRFQDAEADPVGLAVSGDVIGYAIRRTDQLPAGYQNSGFFATAYDLNGEVVISYRGTDFGAPGAELWEDVFNGWLASTGTYTAQLAAAELFYETVAGDDPFGGANSNVVLTGHSLGARRGPRTGADRGQTSRGSPEATAHRLRPRPLPSAQSEHRERSQITAQGMSSPARQWWRRRRLTVRSISAHEGEPLSHRN
ncbi:MAG: hypothetical protein U5J99_06065 [Parvularculaceae bacterium]|nr:hypothetical protein [Parvularculaceae bacterium]